jgi:hypothetical protein
MSDQAPDSYKGTRAHQPDLDWSQVRETVLVLEVLSGQIVASMRDSEQSVDVLAGSFTSMAGYIRTLSDIIHQMPQRPEDAGHREALSNIAEQVSGMVNQAIVSFQFYDKLVQRLSHVTDGLSDIASLVSDKRRLYNPYEWVDLQGRMQSKFSTEEERALFKAVLGGMSLDEALKVYLHTLNDKGNEIELF